MNICSATLLYTSDSLKEIILKNSLKPCQGLKPKYEEPKTILGEHNRFSKDEDSGIQKGNEPAVRFFQFDI